MLRVLVLILFLVLFGLLLFEFVQFFFHKLEIELGVRVVRIERDGALVVPDRCLPFLHFLIHIELLLAAPVKCIAEIVVGPLLEL